MSLSTLGERRKILRSPEDPHMKALKAQMGSNGCEHGESNELFNKAVHVSHVVALPPCPHLLFTHTFLGGGEWERRTRS
jgi:hypothetical protein